MEGKGRVVLVGKLVGALIGIYANQLIRKPRTSMLEFAPHEEKINLPECVIIGLLGSSGTKLNEAFASRSL